jgi:hypothetical protein
MKKSASNRHAALAVLLLGACVLFRFVPAQAQVVQPATTPAHHPDITQPQRLTDVVRARRQVYLWVRVKGLVQDGQGRPCPGVEVTLLRPTEDDMGRHRIHCTNRKGKFAFRTFSRAGYYLVTTTDGKEKISDSDGWILHGRRFPGLVLTRYFLM